MNELSYLQAIILGLVQGLTEFLPVSSSGHLALGAHWFDLQPESQSMLIFDIAVHLGTVLAVTMVFARKFIAYFTRLIAETNPKFEGRRIAWKIAALGVVASIPTAIIGLTFKDQLEQAFGNRLGIGIALIGTGSLLWITGKIPRPKRGWRRFGWGRAFVIGLGQGIAILPGVSRSGTTISLAMLCGIKRQWAGEFSFFIAIPAICGAALLQIKDVINDPAMSLSGFMTGPLLMGALVATATGYFALRLLMSAVRNAKLHYFCYYCWMLGLIVIVAMR
ncbi:MAG TPA: undecaprenyl-diphosphate phosphatase [Phycisphaerae bacterium]|nr:undecaprenyl-diphosphate phosphatase [Phycisphaerae bacterium]